MLSFHFILVGVAAGVLSALFGIGGGVLIVPLLIALGLAPIKAVATSTLAISLIATFATGLNLKKKLVDFRYLAAIAIPAVAVAPVGAQAARMLSAMSLLIGFAVLVFANVALMSWKSRLVAAPSLAQPYPRHVSLKKVLVGLPGGILAGLFGVGGGIVMVPLQVVLLGERVRSAARNSLGVVALAAFSALCSHWSSGNVLAVEGSLVGIGGVLGTQLGDRALSKLKDQDLHRLFCGLMSAIGLYLIWQAIGLQGLPN